MKIFSQAVSHLRRLGTAALPALMLVGAASAQTRIAGSANLELDTTQGTIEVVPSYQRDFSFPFRLSSLWGNGTSGTLTINGIVACVLGIEEEQDFPLVIPANSGRTYECVFTTGNMTYRRTITTTGARKFAQSEEMELDTRMGKRYVEAGDLERIRYNSLWASNATDSAKSTLRLNGEIVNASSGEGEYEWTVPAIGGDYVFTHTTTITTTNRIGRRCVIRTTQVGETLTAHFVLPGRMKVSTPTVTSIAPFGLAIDYTVSEATSDDAGRSLEISFVANGVTNIAQTLVGETNCVNGAHRVYWNMAADGITADVTNAVVSVAYAPTYCVVDLETHEVQYLEISADSLNTDEYKTAKIVLKRVPAGTFIMGDDQTNEARRVTLTKPFYLGLFEVTQKQWELVMGSNSNWDSYYGLGDSFPAYEVSYDDIRGSSNGASWPATSSVDDFSFLGKLRTTVGGSFDLPTEAQWEYVCRAGTTNAYSYGDSADDSYMWYSDDWGTSSSGTYGVNTVGMKLPNPWGFYDMHGNVWEWCLDWHEECDVTICYAYLVGRGGAWDYPASYCKSAYREDYSSSSTSYDLGFRLAQTLTSEVLAQEIAATGASVSNVTVVVTSSGATIPADGCVLEVASHGTTNGVVKIDGEELENAGGGDAVAWRPSRSGHHVLSQVIGDVVLETTYDVLAKAPSVGDLQVTPLSPFGLALDFTATDGLTDRGDEFALQVVMSANGVTNIAKTLVGETNCVNGAHRVYWNMAADGITMDATNGVVTVMYLHNPLYCVIDLSGGADAERYSVAYLETPPAGGFTNDVYKTSKLVLRLCPAGTDPLDRYFLTKDYYAGVFPITQKQWKLVMGSSKDWASYGQGDTYPAYYISYNEIRGSSEGTKWPQASSVDADSFVGKLRTKTGLAELDLPTEAQWEYACRAGTTTTYCTGDDEADLAKAGWYSGNSGGTTHPVGEKVANDWGLYDMHGNVEEWCLDWHDGSLTGLDPVGATSGTSRRLHGGSRYHAASSAASSAYGWSTPSSDRYYTSGFGFRLFRTVPSVLSADDRIEGSGASVPDVATVSNVSVSVIADQTDLLVGEYAIDYAPHGMTNAVVAIDGEEVVNAVTAGTYQWLADEAKTYALTYSLGDAVMSATYDIHALPPTVSGLKVTPIRPWGVRLDYELTGVTSDNEAFFPYITMSVGGKTNAAWSLQGDWKCAEGSRRVYWNMAADGISLDATNVEVSVVYQEAARYCVIDLSGGETAQTYPLVYLNELPEGGFDAAEYKTTKLVLKRVEPGSFFMGVNQADEACRVTLTKPFYMGLFEVTQKQWELVMGTNPSYFSGEMNPVEQVSYNDIRGARLGSTWPVTDRVDGDSFLGRLRKKTGLAVDLPTNAQWEYVCRAGTMTWWNFGDTLDLNYLWCSSNASRKTHEVGTRLPNQWGFYDMHGNVWEGCRDWRGTLRYGTDPVGADSGSGRGLRGGCWNSTADFCATTRCTGGGGVPTDRSHKSGFRLSAAPCLIADEIASVSATTDLGGIVADGETVTGSLDVDCVPVDGVDAVVSANDIELAQSRAAASVAWQPRTTGSFVLQHVVGDVVLSATYNVASNSFWYQPSANAPMEYDADISLGATSVTLETADMNYVVIETSGIGNWTAATSDSWLTLSATSDAAGSSLVCVVDANTNNAAESRMGYVYVAGHVFVVTQAGRGAMVSPLDIAMEQTGGSTMVHVVPGCDPFTHDAASAAETTWRVRPNVDWIHVSCANGVGEGDVTLDVAPWFGPGDRTGTVLVAGQTVTVVQKGEESPQVAHVSATEMFFGRAGGLGTIEVGVASDDVTWSAVSSAPNWLIPFKGSSRKGDGTLQFYVSALPSNTVRREAMLTVGGPSVRIVQIAKDVVFEPGRHYADGGVSGEGQVVTLEATPPDGFEFVRWEGSDGEIRTENPTVVSVSAAEAYEPIFAARRPVITNVVQSAEGVAVAWSNLAWAAEYRVWRGATTNVAEATRLATVARGDALAYRDSTGTTGQGYWYWIEAVDDEEEANVVEDTWSQPVEGAKGEASVVQSLIVYENLKGAANGNPTWYQEGMAMELAAPGELECWEFAGWTPSAITADMTGAQTVTANWTLKSVAAPTSTPADGSSFSGDSCEIALACAVDGARIYFTTNGTTPRTTEKFLYVEPLAIDKTTTVKAIAVYGELKSALMTSVITQKEASEADVAYEAWLDRVAGTDSAKRQAIQGAQYSRLAFALDLGYDAAVSLAPKEGCLAIATFEGTAALTVALDGVSVGANATAENLAEVFKVEGATTLDGDSFSTDNVSATFGTPKDGKVVISVASKTESAQFFIRVKLSEGK